MATVPYDTLTLWVAGQRAGHMSTLKLLKVMEWAAVLGGWVRGVG
jgi:hypothetical protein